MKRAAIAVVFALLTVVLPVWAQEPGAPPPPPGQPAPNVPPLPGAGIPGMGMMTSPLMAVRVPQGPMFERMMTELNLTEDQNAKVKAALEAYGTKSKPLVAEYQESIQQMQSALREPKLDAAKVKAASAKALKAEESLVSISLDFWSTFRGILTAEQNQKFSQIAPGSPFGGFGGPRGNRPPAGGWQGPNRPQGPPPPAP